MKKLQFIIFLIFAITAQAQELVTYEIPKEMFYSAHNDDFTVKVRIPGGEWKDLYEYKVEVDMDNRHGILRLFRKSGNTSKEK